MTSLDCVRTDSADLHNGVEVTTKVVRSRKSIAANRHSAAAYGAILLFSGLAHADECRRDIACPGDQICQTGRCVSADDRGAAVAPPIKGKARATTLVTFVDQGDIEVRTENELLKCSGPCSLNVPTGEIELDIGSQIRREKLLVPPTSSQIEWKSSAAAAPLIVGGFLAAMGGLTYLVLGQMSLDKGLDEEARKEAANAVTVRALSTTGVGVIALVARRPNNTSAATRVAGGFSR